MDMVGSLGIPRWLAYFSAGTEFFGGIGIVLGLFTRFRSLSLSVWRIPSPHGHGGFARDSSLAGVFFGGDGIFWRNRNRTGIVHPLLLACVRDRDGGCHLEGAL